MKTDLNITTLKGNPVHVTEVYINGNSKLALVAACGDKPRQTYEQAELGKFRAIMGQGGFACEPALFVDAEKTAREESAARASENAKRAEEQARLAANRLKWGGGSKQTITVAGREISRAFVEAELQRRGIPVDTDWERYHSHGAEVNESIQREIAAACDAQGTVDAARREQAATLPVVETREIGGFYQPGDRVGNFVVVNVCGVRRATDEDDEMDRSSGADFMSRVELATAPQN